MVAMQLFQAAPAAVSVQTEQSLRALSAEVVRALDLLQGPRVQRLYQLQTSRRYDPPWRRVSRAGRGRARGWGGEGRGRAGGGRGRVGGWGGLRERGGSRERGGFREWGGLGLEGVVACALRSLALTKLLPDMVLRGGVGRYLERLSETLQQQLRLSKAMLERLGSNNAKRTRRAEQIQEATAAIAQHTADARTLKQTVRARRVLTCECVE